MIKSLYDAQMTDGLPRILAGQDWVQVLSEAMNAAHRKTMDFAARSQIYTAIDTAPEAVLEALAVNWKIDWYNSSYSIDQKRRIIKTAMDVRRRMGTAYAARIQADAIYPGTKLEEWFEYGGTPGCFRLYVDVTGSSEEEPVTAANAAALEAQLTAAKRWSAHLDSLSYTMRHGIQIGANVTAWKYRVPLCGCVVCGEWWTHSTLGWSEHQALQSGAGADGYTASPPLTGTLPEVSAQGYSLSRALKLSDASVPTASGSAFHVARSGELRCGAVHTQTGKEA